MDEEGRVRFSTRTIVQRERTLLQNAHQLAQRSGHRVREANVEQALALAELELSEREHKPITLNAEQAGAVRHVAQGGDLALVQGFAGTGKSTMLYAARLAYEAQGFTVVGGAYTGRAAEGLETGSRIPSATLHSWQARWAKGQDRLTGRHVFIIDEAAMVGTEQFGRVIEEVRARGAKLVLVGDTEQIQPIEIGAPMRLLQEQYTPARLTDVVRQRAHAWQRQATHDFGDRKPDAALQAYLKEGRVHACESAEAAHLAMIEAWARARAAQPSESSLLLAFRRTDVFTLNQFARDIRKAAGELGEDLAFQTERGKRDFALGDRLLFLRNDRALGVKNGTLGTIERIAHRRLVVRLDDQRTVEVDARTYNALDHGYASTINKSQSATVDRTYVFASRYMERSKTYVALSRHRQDAHLFFSREEFSATEKLIRCLSRERRDRMAHEVAPHLSADAALRAALVPADNAFARAKTADPGAEMRAVSPTATLPPLDLHAIILQLEDVRQLAIAERDAGRDVAQAVRALEAFGGGRTGSREYAMQLAELERTQQAHTRARQNLDRATRDPRVVARATRIAQDRNARIDRARQRLAELEAYRREVQQANWLRQLARTANEKAKRLVFRVAEDRDAALPVRALRTLENGQQLVELGTEKAGARVLAAPSFCARHGIDLASRMEPSQPRPRGRDDTGRHH
ncbi:MAG TPA: AAA family ATPase [Polyangiales bacterium]|nr:AAA family ATPase [Polyangiales bacterium]